MGLEELWEYIENKIENEMRIFCPHCGEEYKPEWCDESHLVTYHGYDDEGDEHELECGKCEESFWVREIVSRQYESHKTQGEE